MSVEPASAASVAGILKLAKNRHFVRKQNMRIVCVLTGHGLKDPDRVIASVKKPKSIRPKLEAVLEYLKL